MKLSLLQVDSEALMTVDGLKEAAITQQTSREEAAARAVADYNKKALVFISRYFVVLLVN